MKSQTLRTARRVAMTLHCALLLSPAMAQSQTPAASPLRTPSVREIYEQHNNAANSARTAGDWATVRRHAAAVDTLFNGNPSSLLAMARAHARMGDSSGALEIVRTVVAMGLSRNLSGDKDLASLHSLAEWPVLVAKNEENARPIGEPRVLFALPDLEFIAEDIVWDGARSRYLVSSVRKGVIVSVHPSGTSSQFASRASIGGWGAFALGVDSARSRLWVTTVAMPHVAGYAVADSGKSAILRLDLRTGAVQKRYELPPHPRGTSPGDVAVAPGGDLYVSDSRTGVIHVIRTSVDSLEVLVPEGTFMSPQSPAVSPDTRTLYVADYIRGLAEVDLASRTVRWLRHERAVALNGIDGLVMPDERTLVAVQNGVMPNRVMELRIDRAAGVITAVRVLAQNMATIHEPTHGVMMGGELHFIANSGWDGFGDDGVPLEDVKLTPPVILAIRLR